MNPFRKEIFEYAPVSSGEYDAVTDGYFLLLTGLPEGSHRIRFGGKGRLEYRTDSVYDLFVDSTARPSRMVDISKPPPKRELLVHQKDQLDRHQRKQIPCCNIMTPC